MGPCLKAATAALSVCLAGASLAITGAATQAAHGAASHPLRVGSYNISGVNGDSTAKGDRRVWRERRARVAGAILAQDLQVVGLQEANPSHIYASRMGDSAARTQYDDLVHALNDRGGNYAVTTTASYNCANSSSSYACSYRDNSSALSNRILYDRDVLSLVSKGSMKYSVNTAHAYDRYLEWATFTIKSTGSRFLFTNTHLDPYSDTIAARQWREAIAKTTQLRGSLPVVGVGDYNIHRSAPQAKDPMAYTVSQGLPDALGQTWGTVVKPAKPRAERSANIWMGSFNGYRRNVATWALERDRTGRWHNQIDWIFASSNLRVIDYRLVVDADLKKLRMRGVIPSDHNLVKSVIVVP